MNTVITSREAIMQVCRCIVAEKGMKALNMRLVADQCHIALGTLYILLLLSLKKIAKN